MPSGRTAHTDAEGEEEGGLKEKVILHFSKTFWVLSLSEASSLRVSAYLVLVQLTVLILLLALLLERDDDEAHKDVHHEEGDEDDVDDKEDGHVHAVVEDRTHVLFV